MKASFSHVGKKCSSSKNSSSGTSILSSFQLLRPRKLINKIQVVKTVLQ